MVAGPYSPSDQYDPSSGDFLTINRRSNLYDVLNGLGEIFR
jgi:hypothetical protein